VKLFLPFKSRSGGRLGAIFCAPVLTYCSTLRSGARKSRPADSPERLLKQSLLIVVAAMLPGWAAAQVTVDPAALSQLAGISAPPHVMAEIQPAHHALHRRRTIIPVAERLPLPPPAPAPVAVTPPPPAPKPVLPPATIGIKFAAGSSTLPAGTATALQPFCQSTVTLGINARAPGEPSDPSIAMRLSLARALAVRDALTACGVPLKNILPRALGAAPGQNEDETMLGIATK
jgi:hypothetical protein